MSHLESRAAAELPVSRPGPVRIGRRQYVRAPVPIHFPSEERPEDAVPETKRHLEARTTLYLLLKDALAGHAIGSDQFVYWDATDPRRCVAPDVFVKRGTSDAAFDVWKVWERGAPELAVEIVSATDRRDDDWRAKLASYLAAGVAEVVRFDPSDEETPIRVWDRVDEDLVERAPADPDARECALLGLWWVKAPSEYGPQLRLARDREGKELLPTPEEERIRLAQELADERKARTAAEHAQLLAEHARKQAEEAQARAERERDEALAELAKLRAERGERGERKPRKRG